MKVQVEEKALVTDRELERSREIRTNRTADGVRVDTGVLRRARVCDRVIELPAEVALERKALVVAGACLHPGNVRIVQLVERVKGPTGHTCVKAGQCQRRAACPASADMNWRRPADVAQDV